ncbi:MAG: response regulator [Ferruginibacter sp.]
MISERKHQVIIIDDDIEDQEIFQDALHEVDSTVECITFRGCEEALGYLEKNLNKLPEYIFLDLNMPKMNGKQCLKVLKENASLKNIPVIIYSTSYQQKEKDETASLGASYFLTKPTSIIELKKQIKHILTLPV